MKAGRTAASEKRGSAVMIETLGSKWTATADRWLCERVQRGLESPQYRPGPLSTLETWMFEFHDLLERAIPEIRADAPPANFT